MSSFDAEQFFLAHHHPQKAHPMSNPPSQYVDPEFEAMLESLCLESISFDSMPFIVFCTPDGEGVYLDPDEAERFSARIIELRAAAIAQRKPSHEAPAHVALPKGSTEKK